MESIAALSLASNIIQIVDFSSRIISRGHELYNSADGRLGEHAVLENAARNLSELYTSLHKSKIDSEPEASERYRDLDVSGTHRRIHDLTVADQQLKQLALESENIVQDLQVILKEVRLVTRHKKWQSIHQAIKSVRTDTQIAILASRLDEIRKQIDTAVLFSICDKTHRSFPVHDNDLSTTNGRLEGDAKRRHVDLMSAVQRNDWRPSHDRDVNAFSLQMGLFTEVDIETRFQNTILRQLYFRQLPNRANDIPIAHKQTLEWLFKEKPEGYGEQVSANLPQWLQKTDSSIYWVTGKPGAGKSTLMKYVYCHPSLPLLLQKWAKDGSLIMASFYFWNSGSSMQMSCVGLLQALMHACFSQSRSLLLATIPERWKDFVTFGGGQESFDEPELRRIFKSITSNTSHRFFFLIDGLDELHGEPRDIIKIVIEAAKPNVKLCVASRPWLPFEDAFNRRPSLLLEHLTRKDISIYVTEHFQANEHYNRLWIFEPMAAAILVPQVVDKACGVFLWVRLVVESLLEGLSNADRVSDLQARLDALPPNLESLFDFILRRLRPEYFKQACETFRLVRSYREAPQRVTLLNDVFPNPSPLGLYFADDIDTESCIQAAHRCLNIEDACRKAEQMSRRINARCKGLLEAQRQHTEPVYDYTVSYLHRTARDYVESDTYWNVVLDSTNHFYFQPQARWANASLWLHKVHPTVLPGDHSDEYTMTSCLDSAITMYEITGKVQATYLNEIFLGSDVLEHGSLHDGGFFARWTRWLSSHDSMADYLRIVLLSTQLKPEQYLIVLKLARWTFSGYHSDVRLSPRAIKRLHKTYEYHNSLGKTHWLHRLPRLPPYE